MKLLILFTPLLLMASLSARATSSLNCDGQNQLQGIELQLSPMGQSQRFVAELAVFGKFSHVPEPAPITDRLIVERSASNPDYYASTDGRLELALDISTLTLDGVHFSVSCEGR